MIENWEQYKDLEYYPDRFCACGCGGRIKVKPYHKYGDFIPEYIHGHNNSGLKLPREIRICRKAGCYTTFEVSIHSTQKYCSHKCSAEVARSCRVDPYSIEVCRKISNTTSKNYMNGFNPKSCYKHGYVFLDRLGVSLYFRSSYEEKALLFINDLKDIISVETEVVRIEYMDKEGHYHYYLPDILVEDVNGNSYLIEVKPSGQVQNKRNQLKFKAALDYVSNHNMKFLIWGSDWLFSNNNGSTTASLQEIVEATVATLSESGKVMIQSELYGNIEKQAEMTCSPILVK